MADRFWPAVPELDLRNLACKTRYDPATKGLLPVSNTLTTLPAIPDMFAPGFAYIGGPVVGPDGNQGVGGLAT